MPVHQLTWRCSKLSSMTDTRWGKRFISGGTITGAFLNVVCHNCSSMEQNSVSKTSTKSNFLLNVRDSQYRQIEHSRRNADSFQGHKTAQIIQEAHKTSWHSVYYTKRLICSNYALPICTEYKSQYNEQGTRNILNNQEQDRPTNQHSASIHQASQPVADRLEFAYLHTILQHIKLIRLIHICTILQNWEKDVIANWRARSKCNQKTLKC